MKRLWSFFILGIPLFFVACNLGTRSAVTIPSTPLAQPTNVTVESTIPPVTTSQPTTIPTAPAVACVPISGWQTYIIQRGDTISSIASKTNSTTEELVAANCLENPNRIVVGDSIFVPNLPSEQPPIDGETGLQTFIEPSLLAFEYPANWIESQFTGGLGGAMVGTMALGDEPPGTMRWDDDMVTVSFTNLPEEFAPETLEDWVTQIRNEWDAGGRTTIIAEPASVTLPSGISGYVMIVNASNHNQKQYYLDINGEFVVITVAGNIPIGDTVALTIRPA